MMTKEFRALDEVCEITMGQSPTSSSYNSIGKGLPFFQGKTEFGAVYPTTVKWCSSPKKIAQPNDILLSVRAPVGATNLAKEKCCIGRGLASLRVHPKEIDRDFLHLQLKYLEKYLVSKGQGSTFEAIGADILKNIQIIVPKLNEQKEIATKLNAQLTEIRRAGKAVEVQLSEVDSLANVLIYESINQYKTWEFRLGDVLNEVKKGIGEDWNEFPVYGATRSGIAMAKEPPGKNPQRYKPITPGTVFYNPMRIMIGSIAFAEDDVADGITSPDYVVLKGKDGMIDSRWFYYWLRSPLGEQCINSLARGAVRERMLFNRLAEGSIELPDIHTQKMISKSLQSLKSLKAHFTKQRREFLLLPQKILAQTFEAVSQ